MRDIREELAELEDCHACTEAERGELATYYDRETGGMVAGFGLDWLPPPQMDTAPRWLDVVGPWIAAVGLLAFLIAMANI